MNPSAVQLQFAAEFALFLVAASGLALTVLRGDLLAASRLTRMLSGMGFAGLAVAAFLHGSLLREVDAPVVLAARGLGLAGLLAGAMRWRSRTPGRLATVAVVAGTAALVAAVNGALNAAAGFRILSALVLGGGLLASSRRAVATRIAASAAGTLLLLVLVISVGLSAVLDSQVEDEAVRRLDARARAEATEIFGERRERLLAAAEEVRKDLVAAPTLVLAAAEGNAIDPVLDDRFREASEELFQLPLAFINASGTVIAEHNTSAAGLLAVAGSDLFREAVDRRQARVSPLLLGRQRAALVAISPAAVRGPAGTEVIGGVVALDPLNQGFLDSQIVDDASLSVSLISRQGVVAEAGDPGPAAPRAELGGEVLEDGEAHVAITEDRFLAGAPVLDAAGDPTLALVVSQPTTAVENTRRELFSTLFLIALGGTILALLLAAMVGEQIGSGIRRLTTAAGAIQGGDLSARTGLGGDDEVGMLGAAFDSMAGSIEEKTEALRQAAEDEARLRNRLQAIVAGMGEGLIAVDADGAVTEMNAAAEDLLTMPASQVVGRPLAELAALHDDEGAELLSGFSGRRWSATGVLHTGGAEIPVAATAGPLEAPDGRPGGGVLVLRDLRREREVERMKREFLSRVGHELRTPLAPILGFAQILATREVPPERVRDIHQTVYESARRLERIVIMLEFFASLQAGRRVLTPVPTDVRDVVTATVDDRAATLDGAHSLTRRIARGLPMVAVDRAWLQRSIAELIDNAAKFSPTGGPITVRVEPAEHEGRPHVAIRVADRGVGMEEQALEAAFSEWSQGDESDTRAYGGLGLGLPLVRRVVEGHGGEVLVEATPGKGTKVSILLPALPKEEGDEAPSRPAGRRRLARRLRAG